MTDSERQFGAFVRSLRRQRREPLRVVAAALEVDSTLLSKIERGTRFPTSAQVERFAVYYRIPVDELAARAIADRIVAEYGQGTATLQAANIVRERAATYLREDA